MKIKTSWMDGTHQQEAYVSEIIWTILGTLQT